MSKDSKNSLMKISDIIHAKAMEDDSDVSPSLSRIQKDRLRAALANHYIALDDLNYVFQDINSTSALTYFDKDDAALIRQAASSLSDARRAIRRLANSQWLRKRAEPNT